MRSGGQGNFSSRRLFQLSAASVRARSNRGLLLQRQQPTARRARLSAYQPCRLPEQISPMCRRISTRLSPRVRQPLAELLHSVAQLGIVPSSYNLTPRQIIAEFYRRDPQGDINKIYAQIMREAPSLKQAQASLEHAQRDLDQAKLDLRLLHDCGRDRWRCHPSQREPRQ